MRIVAVNQTAARLGLAPGLTLADARAQIPDLVIADHDPEADAAWLDRLADLCIRFTPMVAVDPPQGLLLDITGCTHLFGTEEELEKAVHGRFAERGVKARTARAQTAAAAHALARFGKGKSASENEAIRALPVAALELDEESDLGLRRAGLKTVGAVADRSRAAIAARFGKAAIFALECLTGEGDSPLDPRQSEPPLVLTQRFAEPIVNGDFALQTVGDLLEQAAAKLAERDLGGRAFEAAFVRSDGLIQRLRVETGLPTRNAAAVVRLFDERIEKLGDPLDPGFGFDSIHLTVPETEKLRPAQGRWDSEREHHSDSAQLLDRLSVRLGPGNVQRFVPRDTHIPEKDQIALSPVEAPGNTAWSVPVAGEPPMRPLHLFDPPERIAVIAEVPDGPPYRFTWRRRSFDVVRHEGPERIASEWWTSCKDPLGEKRLTRDYYRIEDSSGHRYWVFRHGLYGREKADPAWYMHGLFA